MDLLSPDSWAWRSQCSSILFSNRNSENRPLGQIPRYDEQSVTNFYKCSLQILIWKSMTWSAFKTPLLSHGLYGPCHCYWQLLSLTFFLPHRASGWDLWPLMNCLILCFWLWAISMTSILSVWHPWEAGRPYWPVNLTEPWVFSGILLLQTNLCGKSKNAFGAGESQVLTLVLP